MYTFEIDSVVRLCLEETLLDAEAMVRLDDEPTSDGDEEVAS